MARQPVTATLLLLCGLFFPVAAAAQTAATLFVNRTDPTCGGQTPCFRRIQTAINAALSRTTIRIQAGTYPEQLEIKEKNDFSSASETDRIVIEADPASPPGSVVVTGSPGSHCTDNRAIRIRESRFITIRDLTITGASGQAILLLGGSNQNRGIHIELNRIFRNGSGSCDGGITIRRGNPDTLIVNNLIYGNGGNGISITDEGGGPHYVINNTIASNGWNGVDVARGHVITLANNIINNNGTATGTTGGRFGIRGESSNNPQPARIKLLNNLICGNSQAQISSQILDATDASNYTQLGYEGPGVSALPGCELEANIFANRNGPDGQANTADDDFSLKANSLAIDVGMDPRALGFNPSYNPIFEADFVVEGIRPADGNADRAPAFDAGAFEYSNAPPVANAGANQNVSVGQLVALNGAQSTDPEGASLSYQWSVASQPAGSAIVLSGATTATPTFVPLMTGPYSFRLVVSDGQFLSAASTVVVDALRVNQAPTAANASASTNEDAAVVVTLSAADVDSANLSFAIVTNPTHGTLGSLSTPTCVPNGSGSNCTATVTYTPAANYSGADSFTFKANDGGLDSNTATIGLTVGAVNDAPVASNATISTNEDSAVNLTLTASDVDNTILSFSVVSAAANGSLGELSSPSCVANGAGVNCSVTVTYTPNANFNGSDSITFKANDGTSDSNSATASIILFSLNDSPVAQGQTVATNEDSPVAITLAGNDVDNTGLTFAIATGPTQGTLGSIGAPNCIPAGSGANCTATATYTPGTNFSGSDSFTFKVNDGTIDSNTATVSLTVNAVNDPAVAANDFFSTDLNATLTMGAPGVLGNDNDTDNPAASLTAVLVTGPTNAASFTLNPNGSFTYTPNLGFTGTDTFTYKANDGTNDSNNATVTIAVVAASGSPVAINDFYNTEKDTALHVPARGVLANDNDADTALTSWMASLVSGPTRALSFTLNPDGSFEYTPLAGFTDNDSFTYKVNDGTSDSNVAMVTIAVIAPNIFPVAKNDSEATNEDSARAVPAPGVLLNDAIAPLSTSTVVLSSGPRHALSFAVNADGSFNYTPHNDYNGSDSFTYRIFDGTRHSNVAMVNIAVVPINDLPVAQAQSLSTNQNTPVILTLSASDIDHKVLSFSIATPPANGTLGTIGTPNCTGQGQGATCTATVSYAPATNFAGPDSFAFTTSDGVGTGVPATVSIDVILVNRPPTANAGGPYTGNVGVPIQFSGTGSDPDGNPITFAWNFGDGGTGTGPNPVYTYSTAGTYTATLTVNDSFNASATSQTTATIGAGVVLNPIGSKTVNLGETLTFIVAANDPNGGPVSLFVEPLPLMQNATFNARTGVFTFRPATTQVGSYQLTFSASNGITRAAETITITVPNPPPGGSTGVRGRVVNLAQTALANVTVTLRNSGHTGVTGADGYFTINGVPSGTQQLILNGRQANLGVYAIIAVAAELIDGVLNNLSGDISLPDVDLDAEVQVSPTFNTIVSNPNVPGVELEIVGGSATNADGTPFTGKLSINPVPDYGRPESRPEELRPGFAITIQPAGIRFNPPARLTFPNADGMATNNDLNLWSLSPDTGKFNLVGQGTVSADGQTVITTEGGVSASAWHFFLPPATTSNPSQGNNFCGSCRTAVGSEANLEEGSLFIMHGLPSYRSLGQSRSLSLTYGSVTADPRPIISLDSTLGLRAAVPNSFSTRLKVGGVQQGGEIFTNSSSLPENADSTSRLSVQFDASNLVTGRYPFEATVFSNYLNSSVGGISTGNIIVVNRTNSALGSGWTVTDIQQLHPQTSGGVLLTSGDGTALFFAGGPDMFAAPAREFSALVRNPDGTYTRTFKDGTKVNFNAEGLQASVVDRNSNTTTFSYDASGRLATVTDPVGLVTTLTYSGAKLQRITDPAGRQTLFQHDAAGNLTRITNPDSTFKTFVYDNKNQITQATDERGLATTYAYDAAGRFAQSTRPSGENRALVSTKLKGLVDTAGGQGTATNPAPITSTQNAHASLTDGRGNQSRFTLDALGQVIAQTDALGQTTSTVRDPNGLPTRITRPNGAVTTMTYDANGNLLSSTDPIGATATFTYEPTFNQVKTIRDPKGSITTINYDAAGNPIEIIDALNQRTQMTYNPRGLLTSVTAAVGTAVQTSTSFTYDVRGNLLTTTDPRGSVTTLAYDAAGNVQRSIDAENRITQFTYDARNRLVAVLDADLKTTHYSYDPRGNLAQVRDAKNQTTTFVYDGLDRLASATNPLGLSETFTYDANGNLTSTTNRNGQTISFNYDALNRLVSKARPPTSMETTPFVTAYAYDPVGNLLSVINPTIGVFNTYDAANRLTSTITGTESASAGLLQINSDTLIAENDFQYEGRPIQVNGRVLTVDGAHTFGSVTLLNGAVLTHSPSTATKINKLDLTVSGVLHVDGTSRIDANGRGYLGGKQAGNLYPYEGMTFGFGQGSTIRTGGSYGGLGGAGFSSNGTGVANSAYGDFRNPSDAGSGGGNDLFTGPYAGGNGGGLIRIVAQTLQLDGIIRANGGSAIGDNGGGGSGGGIRIDVETIQGTGQINANGGNGSPKNQANVGDQTGGGGGGRIAIYYQNATGFNFANVLATGGIGHGAPNGGAGTVYLQGPSRESGELIVDNNNIVPSFLSTPLGSLALTHFKVRGASNVGVTGATTLSGALDITAASGLTVGGKIIAGTIAVTGSSTLTHLLSTGTTTYKLDVNTQNLTIDSASRIDADQRGYLGAKKPGNPFSHEGMTLDFASGSTIRTGGSYGGLGGAGFSGNGNGVANAAYGDLLNPNEVGSGGGNDLFGGPHAGGNGGGLVRIVAQTLLLDGIIKANGGNATGDNGGGGSGGGIRIDVGTIQGTGQINANGGNGSPKNQANVGDQTGGGGGGRIAIYYQSAIGFNFANVLATGGIGHGAPNGQNGTVHIQQQTAKLDPTFGDAVPVMTAQGERRRERRQVSPAVPAASEHPHAYAHSAATLLAPGELQQRKFVAAEAMIGTQSQLLRDHTNLYLAIVAVGKLKPFATTAILSQGSGASGDPTRNSRLDTRNASTVFFDKPKSKIENPKSSGDLLTPNSSLLTAEDLDPIYTYDLNGNRTSMIDPTGLTTYQYDALNRLTSITNNKAQTTTFAYDALGRRTSMTHANGVVTTYSYDAASQLTRLAHQLGAMGINAFDYVYDRVGNRTAKTSRDGVHNYTYDTLNRLTQAVNPLPSNPLETFNFDPVGNRTNSNQNGASIFNTANQLLEDANFTYQYDNNGNQTRKTAKVGGAVTQYEYDADNKLVRVVSPTNTANYKYDGLGRRVEKEVIAGTATLTKYVYDNEDILLELNDTNQIVARYTHGPGIDEPLIMEKNSQSFFYHADGLGSITDLTNQSGTVAQRYTYSSFGKIESILDAGFVQPYAYTSREWDSESGLYYYRARYYDAHTGRFIAEDSKGFGGGLNFYSYTGNSPTGRVDPYGLDWLSNVSNFSAGAGDYLSGGFMNTMNLSKRLFGHSAIPISQLLRGELVASIGLNDIVDRCSWAYAAGEFTGMMIGDAILWSGGLNGGANSVLWQGYRQGAKAEARILGTTLDKTPIGSLLDAVGNIAHVPQPIWKIASATFVGNASGTVKAVIRGAGEIATKIELPILRWRNIPVVFK